MKILIKTRFIFLFLALVFSVAVSGGCGGGGGHYSGDFGNSGDSAQEVTPEEVTTESVSSDVMPPEPDEPVLPDQFGTNDSDSDEYGAGQMDNSLKLLNRTVWKIESIDIVAMSGQSVDKHFDIAANSLTHFGYNRKIAFLVSNDSICWAKPGEKRKVESINLTNLTIDFSISDDQSQVISAPFFRPANNFKKDEAQYSYKASLSDKLGGGSEYINLSTTSGIEPHIVAKSLFIINDFTHNGVNYRCTAYLTIDLFYSLNQTDWQIQSIRIFDANDANITPDKFPVDLNSFCDQSRSKINTSKLTLMTSDLGSFMWANDQNSHYKGDNLSVIFTDTLSKPRQKVLATLIKPDSRIEYASDIVMNGYQVFRSDRGEELIYISDYGPNANITINNFCSYRKESNKKKLLYKASYWVSLTLEPYNPNPNKGYDDWEIISKDSF